MRTLISVLIVLVGCESRDSKVHKSGESEAAKFKIDKTKFKLSQYANEAYPQWAMQHPEKQCPSGLSELSEQTDSKDTTDSWGRPIKMLCGSSLPPGVKGIGLVSAGEDGKEGTADDLKSWD